MKRFSFMVTLLIVLAAAVVGHAQQSLLGTSEFVAYKSTRVVFEDEVKPATIIVRDEKIVAIKNYTYHWEDVIDVFTTNHKRRKTVIPVLDAGDLVIMAGLVDSHVHVNDPGRSEWEGFPTATAAAAAGGVTTLVDMPLNSLPPTTTLPNFFKKIVAANGRVVVDVAFWGGIIPGNHEDLKPMLDAGIRGFKCFLSHSGVDEFPNVGEEDLHKAFAALNGTNSKILFHAELPCPNCVANPEADPSNYTTFLETSPPVVEVEAVKLIIELCKKYQVGCHIVHLSSAEALPLIAQAKAQGVPLTVETCPHYLTLSAEEIPNGATQFKCCPPIRGQENREKLWEGILDGTIDMIVSDHSPAPAVKKSRQTGDFLTAWGGISSLQLALPLIWTEGKQRGLNLTDLTRLMSQKPAQLASLQQSKGSLSVGMDADLVIWDPEENITVTEDTLFFRHKLSPYLDRTLQGKVHLTVSRGRPIYSDGDIIRKEYGGKIILEYLNDISP